MDGKCYVHGLIDTIYNELYGLAIGKIYKPEQLAYYNKANQFPQLVSTNIDGSISSVMLPALANEQHDKEKVKSMMRRTIKTSSFLLFPMMLGLAAVAEPLVRIILTDKWLPSVPLMQLLCISYLLWPIHTVNLQAISAMGRSDIFLKLEIEKKVVGVIALLISIPFGIEVMVIMKIVTSIISTFINSYPNKKLLNYSFKEQFRDILPAFALAGIMAMIVVLLNALNVNMILKLAVQVVIGMVFYFIMAYLLKMESLTYIIDIIKGKMRGEKQ